VFQLLELRNPLQPTIEPSSSAVMFKEWTPSKEYLQPYTTSHTPTAKDTTDITLQTDRYVVGFTLHAFGTVNVEKPLW